MHRRTLLGITALAFGSRALAHHGWSSFDQERPIYIEGKVVKVAWRNPHAELEIEIPGDLKLPTNLARRALPAQAAPVDGPGLLARAVLPTRRDKVWEIELAPITRMDAWKVPEIKVGETVSVLGFTLIGEKGDAVVRAEYLFAAGKVYGLRSSPA
jgi:Family of unknown function (DUF6152)